jgi:hypothetical protein
MTTLSNASGGDKEILRALFQADKPSFFGSQAGLVVLRKTRIPVHFAAYEESGSCIGMQDPACRCAPWRGARAIYHIAPSGFRGFF